MSLRAIPLSPVPNQSLSVVLQDRNVALTLRTLDGTLYIDVLCEGAPICTTHVCQDRQLLTARAEYLGFPGLSLWFADLRGTSDPHWSELSSRYLLLSIELTTAERDALDAADPAVLDALVYDGTALYDGTHTYDGMTA